jgi:hypothetical protein
MVVFEKASLPFENIVKTKKPTKVNASIMDTSPYNLNLASALCLFLIL